MADLNKIVDELSTLSVIEAAELSKLLEDKWGVTAAAPVAAAAPTPKKKAGEKIALPSGKKIKQDDLKMVEGIGPKIEGLLNVTITM